MEEADVQTLRAASRTLHRPCGAQSNIHVARAEAESRAWGRTMGLLPNGAAQRRVDGGRHAQLAARVYPTAGLHDLIRAAEWNLWLFVHDDGYDAGPAGRDPAALIARYQELASILHGARPTVPDFAPGHALADLLPRLFTRAPENWRDRFVAAVDDYFVACVWEARNQERGRVPSVAEFVTMGRETAAVRTAIAVIEPCEGIELPEDTLVHPHIEALVDACNDVVCWANDILSVPKGRRAGDVHNLVHVLEYHRYPGDLARALDVAAQMHDQRVGDFIDLTATLPTFGQRIDDQVRRFVDRLRSLMRGNLDCGASNIGEERRCALRLVPRDDERARAGRGAPPLP